MAAKRSPTPPKQRKEDGQKEEANIRNSSNSTHRKLPIVEAPGIRFPKPEVQFSAPIGSPQSRMRGQQRPNSLAANAPPRFFRAANGTQIIQFDDGTTRSIRPRELQRQFQMP